MLRPGASELPLGDLEDLRHARELLERPGLAVRLADLLGSPIERGLALLPDSVESMIQSAVVKALSRGLGIALRTLDNRPVSSRELLHKVLVGSTGALGGVFGLPALAVELPLSTTIMLRAIADIARSEQADLAAPETALSCLEVFAHGGARGKDDSAETGYLAMRAALARSLSEASTFIASHGVSGLQAPVVVRFVGAVASRFGLTVTDKLAASAVPVIGAASSAAINLVFMDHFQSVARGHFIVKRLERAHGEERIQALYRDLS